MDKEFATRAAPLGTLEGGDPLQAASRAHPASRPPRSDCPPPSYADAVRLSLGPRNPKAGSGLIDLLAIMEEDDATHGCLPLDNLERRSPDPIQSAALDKSSSTALFKRSGDQPRPVGVAIATQTPSQRERLLSPSPGPEAAQAAIGQAVEQGPADCMAVDGVDPIDRPSLPYETALLLLTAATRHASEELRLAVERCPPPHPPQVLVHMQLPATPQQHVFHQLVQGRIEASRHRTVQPRCLDRG